MDIKYHLKVNGHKILLITLAFVVIQIHLAFYNYSAYQSEYSLGPSSIYSLESNLIVGITMGLVSGVLCGSLLIFVNSLYFRRRPYWFALATTIVGYTGLFLFFNFLWSYITIFIQSESQISLKEKYKLVWDLMTNEVVISLFFFWGAIILLTLFMLQVSDKFGPGLLLKFILGKYYRPRPEERIFLFADLRSSTTIAEKIGNESFFHFLSEIYADITAAILKYEGEIYQYVGDEIVVSWPLKSGARNSNCVRCFLTMQKILSDQTDKYQRKYGVIPVLKAGLHHGEVIAGEIGIIKRDIAYLGDVLNTASRIQEQCNVLQVDFLISLRTFNLIENKQDFEKIPMGEIQLPGKEETVFLNAVEWREV